jgi:DNA-binding transcriptional ArsR family regulator
MKVLAKNLKALANHRRLEILKYLKKVGNANVGEIADYIKLSFKSTSRHLAVLFAQDIVEKEQVGLEMKYFLANNRNPEIKSVLNLL